MEFDYSPKVQDLLKRLSAFMEAHRMALNADSGSQRAEPNEDPQVKSEDPPYPRARYAWFVVGVLMVAYIFSFVDRQILGLLVGPIRADLNITDTQMSLLMGFSFALFYTFFGIFFGRLADSKSRRTIIAVGIAIWSVMTAGCGLARTYWQLLMTRIGVGVGEAALSPSAYSLITDTFPPHRLAFALSVYGMGIYLGSGMAFLLGGYVVGFAESGGEFVFPFVGTIRPWQAVFFMIGLPGLVFSGFLYTIREPVTTATLSSNRIIALPPYGTVNRVAPAIPSSRPCCGETDPTRTTTA